jgi:hypothetical protein
MDVIDETNSETASGVGMIIQIRPNYFAKILQTIFED